MVNLPLYTYLGKYPLATPLRSQGVWQGLVLPVHNLISKSESELVVDGGSLCCARSCVSLQFLPPTSPGLFQGILVIPLSFFPQIVPFLLLWFLLAFLDRSTPPPNYKPAVSSKALRRDSKASTDDASFWTVTGRALTLSQAVETPSSSTRGTIVSKINMTI